MVEILGFALSVETELVGEPLEDHLCGLAGSCRNAGLGFDKIASFVTSGK